MILRKKKLSYYKIPTKICTLKKKIKTKSYVKNSSSKEINETLLLVLGQYVTFSYYATQKIIYFLDRIRHTYYLDTSRLDDSFALKLQNKSGKDKVLVDAILSDIRDFQKLKTAIPGDLIRLNNLIEEFWNEEIINI